MSAAAALRWSGLKGERKGRGQAGDTCTGTRLKQRA